MARRSKTAAQSVEAVGVANRCIELRIAGKTFRAIAAELGITVSTAHGHVAKYLEETKALACENADLARRLDLDRIESIVESLWDRRNDPKVADAINRQLTRRASLLGLDQKAQDGEADLANAVPPTITFTLVTREDVRPTKE